MNLQAFSAASLDFVDRVFAKVRRFTTYHETQKPFSLLRNAASMVDQVYVILPDLN